MSLTHLSHAEEQAIVCRDAYLTEYSGVENEKYGHQLHRVSQALQPRRIRAIVKTLGVYIDE